VEAEAEFVELATARSAALFRTALLLTGDWHAAEDLVQDTLGKLYVHWARVAKASDPAAYARTTLVRTFLSGRRRRSSGERPRADPDPGAVDDGDAALRLTLLAALARLEPQDRAVLVLRYWEDLDAAATAELLGCSPSAVRTRSRRALARLRQVVGGDLTTLLTG
jgi:RNA polymerase sigma-70 factor (sigma-E family)